MNGVGTRDPEPRTGPQDIDIAAEGFRIRFEDREHRLVHAEAAVGTYAARDTPQRIAADHRVVAAGRPLVRVLVGRGGRCGRLAADRRPGGRRRSRGHRSGRLRLRGTLDATAVRRFRARRRRHLGLRRRRGGRCERRRVKQDRVFPQHAAVRPYRLHEKRQERLRHRRLRAYPDDVAVGGSGTHHFEYEILQVVRALDPVAVKGFRAGQGDLQVLHFLGRGGEELDFRAQRLVQRRFEPYFPKP